MTDKLQIKRRFFFEILIWMIWTQTILMQYVRAAVMRIPVIGSYPDAVMAVLYIVVIGLSLPEFRLSAKDIHFLQYLFWNVCSKKIHIWMHTFPNFL